MVGRMGEEESSCHTTVEAFIVPIIPPSTTGNKPGAKVIHMTFSEHPPASLWPCFHQPSQGKEETVKNEKQLFEDGFVPALLYVHIMCVPT